MSHKNKDVKKHTGQLQSEGLKGKYLEVRSDYTGFNNVRKNKNENPIFRSNSNLINRNPYMRYELNNTFQHKDKED